MTFFVISGGPILLLTVDQQFLVGVLPEACNPFLIERTTPELGLGRHAPIRY